MILTPKQQQFVAAYKQQDMNAVFKALLHQYYRPYFRDTALQQAALAITVDLADRCYQQGFNEPAVMYVCANDTEAMLLSHVLVTEIFHCKEVFALDQDDVAHFYRSSFVDDIAYVYSTQPRALERRFIHRHQNILHIQIQAEGGRAQPVQLPDRFGDIAYLVQLQKVLETVYCHLTDQLDPQNPLLAEIDTTRGDVPYSYYAVGMAADDLPYLNDILTDSEKIWMLPESFFAGAIKPKPKCDNHWEFTL